ncbi:hypothetical protein N7468_001466 [Penicillium chermesinum]|uniref:Altered inheritance of mitochondria protein 6 n=1 Tax=Penicillium chermesinum TaxID=63820 RepID=A0A9W9PGN0_9EURO|nr:uncharacterized protein N7468_001466 [Penicillium chermesinum]KAJ5246483.1 hypothetical protein N7468_001466 [Penicillium chermesinum]KAJ6144755.1 hypothetical protein N7470_008650 [Penicillium chermesinum]
MRSSYRAQDLQTPDTSECLLEVPYEAYTDSPELNGAQQFAAPAEVIPARVGSIAKWRQFAGWIPSFSPRRDGDEDDSLPLLSGDPSRKKRACRSRYLQHLRRTLLFLFIMLGIIQFVSLAYGITLSFFPDEYDLAARHWMHAGTSNNDTRHWPTDVSRDIVPVGCHSHNDYWRRVPLFSALQAGCIGVEADVWLFDDELYVGHTTSSLTKRRTLRSLYVDPLVQILERQNPVTPFQRVMGRPPHGVWDTDPDQTLVLLIDFKTDGATTWPAVVKHLAPLRERGFLTYFDGQELVPGPVTVVGTGNTPFDLVTANSTYRDIFFDAPLDKLVEAGGPDFIVGHGGDSGQGMTGMGDTITANMFNLSNSYYASVSFQKAIGFPWPFHFTMDQIEAIRTQVRVAHSHGLKVRYWGIPSWPRSLRNHIWRILAQEGVDLLNVDDLIEATRGAWKIKILDWWW